ncbi:MAG TPA: hypothetical protein ENK89_05460 [Desulfobulbaceae bacterium]|nr:hypothetical protein [Desulfobulbaceae bacterium]HHD62772.1 hypothetical protein [Desulfobulbaceae bacterium]
MTGEERSHILEDELLIVRHSGEIPEIALHATLHYLVEDQEGPQLTLTEVEIRSLQDAALARSREIVLRDLDPANRDLSLYRGVKRSIYNWQRMQDFCGRIGRDGGDFQAVVREALLVFLATEANDVGAGRRSSSINCTAEELVAFAVKLSCNPDRFPSGWLALCEEK